MGILFDKGVEAHTDIFNYIYSTKKEAFTYAPQTSNTFTDQRSLQFGYDFSPQYIINSPNSSMESKKEGMSQAPTLFVLPSQEVSPGLSDYSAPITDMGSEAGGGNIMGDLISLGAIAIIAFILLKYLSGRKKPKKK